MEGRGEISLLPSRPLLSEVFAAPMQLGGERKTVKVRRGWKGYTIRISKVLP